MTNRPTVVHCIGCGRLDSPQACLTACDDQPLELVFAADYDALGDVSDPFRGVRAMRDLLSRLVFATPHPGQPDSEIADGEREQTYRALQAQARATLREFDSNNGAQPRAAEEIDRFATWHCPNCGRVEAPQDCLGICVRRPVEMVPAADYDEARARYEAAHRQLAS
jgi:hypothetical protein